MHYLISKIVLIFSHLVASNEIFIKPGTGKSGIDVVVEDENFGEVHREMAIYVPIFYEPGFHRSRVRLPNFQVELRKSKSKSSPSR